MCHPIDHPDSGPPARAVLSAVLAPPGGQPDPAFHEAAFGSRLLLAMEAASAELVPAFASLSSARAALTAVRSRLRGIAERQSEFALREWGAREEGDREGLALAEGQSRRLALDRDAALGQEALALADVETALAEWQGTAVRVGHECARKVQADVLREALAALGVVLPEDVVPASSPSSQMWTFPENLVTMAGQVAEVASRPRPC